jgi:hypothetical protein
VQVSCFQDTGIQPFVDHSPDDTIRDSLVKNFTQVGARQTIEVLTYVNVEHPALSTHRYDALQLV